LIAGGLGLGLLLLRHPTSPPVSRFGPVAYLEGEGRLRICRSSRPRCALRHFRGRPLSRFEELHLDRLGLWRADTAVERVLDGETVEAFLGPVDLENIGPRLGVVAADCPAAEAAGTAGRRGADPALHHRYLRTAWPRGTRED